MTEADEQSVSSRPEQIVVRCVAADRSVISETTVPVAPDVDLVIGREGDVAVGVEPLDTGVSRRALSVRMSGEDWSITGHNANGVVAHPWAQAPFWLDPGRETTVRWSLVGLRVIGSRSDTQNWVLLERPWIAHLLPPVVGSTTATVKPSAPTPLTSAQLEALQMVFAEHLAWPPVAGAVPATLDVAARRLGVSTAAIYQRLEAARGRAYQLGSHPLYGVTDPDYVYVLARHGYVRPSAG